MRSHQLCALDGSQTAKPRSQTHELIKSSMQGRGHLSFTVTWLRARYSTHTRTSPLFNSASQNSPPSQQEDNATHAHHTHHQTEKTWQRITFRTMQIYTSITATCVSSKPFACQGLTINKNLLCHCFSAYLVDVTHISHCHSQMQEIGSPSLAPADKRGVSSLLIRAVHASFLGTPEAHLGCLSGLNFLL